MFKNLKLKVISLIVVITVIFTNTFNVFALSVYISTGSWTNQNVYMEIDGSTDSGGSGLLKYQYKIGTGAWQDYNVGSLPTITTEGQTTVYAKAIDRANNESPEASAIVKIDKTNPTAGSLTSSVDSYTKNTSYNVIINNVNDTFSGISRVSFPTWTNYNGQDDIVWPVGMKLNGYKYDYSQNVPWTYHGFDITVNTSTQYKLSMEIYISPDANIPASGSTLVAAGEMGYGAASYYDNTKKGQWQKFETTQIPTGTTARILMYPTTSASPATTGYVLFRNITFTQVGVENNNLFAQPDYNDGFSIRGNGNFLKYEENWSYTVKASEHNNEDGLYYTHMYAYDNANNSVYVGGTSVTIDRGIPTAPVINANTNWTNAANVSVSITPGTDNVSGVNKTEYSLLGATVQGWTTYSGTFNITNQGSTTISARTIDMAGNVSTTTTETVKLDRTNPVATSITTSNITSNSLKALVTGASDSLSGVSSVKFKVWTTLNGQDDVKWYTASYVSPNYEYQININNHNNELGEYNIEGLVYDNGGNSYNVGVTKASFNKTPAINLTVPSSNMLLKVDSRPNFSAIITDADLDLMSVKLQYLEGATWVTDKILTNQANGQLVNLKFNDLKWRTMNYNTSYSFRIEVSDGKATTYSPVRLIKKVESSPILNVISPTNNQYMTSGFLQFKIETKDVDNQLFPTLDNNNEFAVKGNGIVDCNNGEYTYDYSQNLTSTYHGNDLDVNVGENYTISFEALISNDANINSTGTTFIANTELTMNNSFNYDNAKKGDWQKFTYTGKTTGNKLRFNIYPTTSVIPATTGYVKYRNISITRNNLSLSIYTDTSNMLNGGVLINTLKGNSTEDYTALNYFLGSCEMTV